MYPTSKKKDFKFIFHFFTFKKVIVSWEEVFLPKNF